MVPQARRVEGEDVPQPVRPWAARKLEGVFQRRGGAVVRFAFLPHCTLPRENANDFASSSHWSTIFLPVKVPPFSDGWSWTKRPRWKEHVLSHEDELTDEEEMNSDEEEAER